MNFRACVKPACVCVCVCVDVVFRRLQLERVQTKLNSEEVENLSLQAQLSSLITSVEKVTNEHDRLKEDKVRQEQEMENKLVVSRKEGDDRVRETLCLFYAKFELQTKKLKC